MLEQLELPGIVCPDLRRLMAHRAELAESLQALNTRRSYQRSWAYFADWCACMNRCPLPATADTVALYLTDVLRRGRKITTARLYYSAINDRHRGAGLPPVGSFEVRALFEGAERMRCEQPAAKTPLEISELRRICLKLQGTPHDIRNRAILTLGFASALRRASLAALDMGDVSFSRAGLTLHIRREKQDQKGRGRTIGVPWAKDPDLCAVRAVNEWLAFRGREPGPLFTRICGAHAEIVRLRPNRISLIVKAAVEGIGLNGRDFGGHSLRSGFVSAAVEKGLDSLLIAAHTGHRSLSSLRRYFRQRDPFRANACVDLGL